MFTPSQINLARLREQAITDQMWLMNELEKASLNPEITRLLANKLIDRTIHYCNFDRAIMDIYDQTPFNEKPTFFQRLKQLIK